jgi:hypothetical protein
MKKSKFGWIFGEKGDDLTVLRKKRGNFYRLGLVKKDYFLFSFPFQFHVNPDGNLHGNNEKRLPFFFIFF